jgi:hypothetical protein
MDTLYVLWGCLVLFGIIALFVMRIKEDGATRRNESAMQSIFRRRNLTAKGNTFSRSGN